MELIHFEIFTLGKVTIKCIDFSVFTTLRNWKKQEKCHGTSKVFTDAGALILFCMLCRRDIGWRGMEVRSYNGRQQDGHMYRYKYSR
jgi:hypothetical protein